jgi:hypothetical protein
LGNNSIEDLLLVWPSQAAAASPPPTVYPYAIDITADGCNLRRLTLANAYNGVNVGAARCTFHDVTIGAMNIGVTIDTSSTTGNCALERTRIEPIFDYGAAFPTNMDSFLRTSGSIGLQILAAARPVMLNDVNIVGYYEQGLVISDNGATSSTGIASNLSITNAVTSIWCDATLPTDGWQFSNAKLSNSGLTNVNVAAGGLSDPVLTFTNSALIGVNSLGAWFTTAGYLEFHNTWGADLPPRAVVQTAIQPSGFAVPNIYPFPIQIYINGGHVTAVGIKNPLVSAWATGGSRDSVILNPNQSIILTYTSAPTWSWFTV